MFCENCGTKLPDEAKFCASCGSKTEVQPVYATVQSTSPNAPTMTYAPPIQPPPIQTSPIQPSHIQPPPIQTSPLPRQVYTKLQPIAYSEQPLSEPLRVGQYIGMLLLMIVPILNIILLFMWSFGGLINLNKKNFARAALILSAIMLIFWIITGGFIMGALDSILDGF